MANLKDQKSTGESIREVVRDVGQAVAKGAGQVADWLNEKAGTHPPMGFARLDKIAPGMAVFSSCGCRMGTVDRLEGNELKLTRGSSPDELHHFVPIMWIARVDEHVHLNKDANEVRNSWNAFIPV